MSRFSPWGLSVLTMVAVATVVLFVTGWGQAIASSVGSVIVKNTPNNPANVHETGTVPVTVGNLPAAPTTQVATQGIGHLDPGGNASLFSQYIDLSAYRSVTLYLSFSQAQSPGNQCVMWTRDPNGNDGYRIDSFFTGGSGYFSKTLDPAPPNLQDQWFEREGLSVDYTFMLTGRTG